MTSKKLGALLRSVPPATAVETLEEPPAEASAPSAAEQAPRKIARASPAVEPEVPLQVLIPASIRKQLALKAAEEGKSLRALVLAAIRSLGITVTDAEIKGKRGRRSA
jgi:hypothetical protein